MRNIVHFGSPTFSTQQYAAGYIGYQEWETGTYSLYWDAERPPLFSKLRDAGLMRVWENSTDFLKAYLWWRFVKIEESWGEFETENYSSNRCFSWTDH